MTRQCKDGAKKVGFISCGIELGRILQKLFEHIVQKKEEEFGQTLPYIGQLYSGPKCSVFWIGRKFKLCGFFFQNFGCTYIPSATSKMF